MNTVGFRENETNFKIPQKVGGENQRITSGDGKLKNSSEGKVSQNSIDGFDVDVCDVLGGDFKSIGEGSRLKTSAQKIAGVELENLEPSKGVELVARLAKGLGESENLGLTQTDKALLSNCAKMLEGMWNSGEALQKAFNEKYEKILKAVNGILNNHGDLSKVSVDGLSKEMLEKIYKFLVKELGENNIKTSYYFRDAKAEALKFCFEFEEPCSLYEELKEHPGSMICLPKQVNGKLTYVILECTAQNDIYVNEIDAEVANLEIKNLKQNKKTIYSKRGTPGRRGKFKNPEDAKYFIGEVLRSNREGGGQNGNDERKYEEIWQNKIEKNSKGSRMPDFTAPLQDSGNGIVGSTSLLLRAVLQNALACQNHADPNDSKVKNDASRLYHLFEMYSRLQILQSCFAWHKNNAGEISLDSLETLNDSLESLSGYVKEHEKKVSVKWGIFVDKIKNFDGKVSEFVAKAMPKIEKTISSREVSSVPSQNLNDVSNAVKNYAKTSESSPREQIQTVEHFDLDTNRISRDPSYASEVAENVTNLMNQVFWNSDKIDKQRDLAIELLNEKRLLPSLSRANDVYNYREAIARVFNDVRKAEGPWNNDTDGWNKIQSAFFENKDKFLEDLNSGSFWDLKTIECCKSKAVDLLNSVDNKSALRMHEYVGQAVELMRTIPLPGDPAWNNYAKMNESDRRNLMGKMTKFVEFFSQMPLVKEISSLDQGSNKSKIIGQLFDRKNLIFPHYELARIINVMEKARIVSFELAKNDSFWGRHLERNRLDSSWFETFLTSGLNFPTNGKDREEQARLVNYIGRDNNKPAIFDCTHGHSHDSAATIAFYDSIVFEIFSQDELRSMVRSFAENYYSAWTDKENCIDNQTLLFLTHPGLCFYCNESSDETGLNLRRAVFKKLKHVLSESAFEQFQRTMNYGVFQSKNFNYETIETFNIAGTHTQFNNSLGNEFGAGWIQESENASKMKEAVFILENVKEEEKEEKEKIKSDKLPNIASQINTIVANPETQTFGLLDLLEHNLELCEGFYESSHRQGVGYRNKSFSFNLWLQAFNRVLRAKDGAAKLISPLHEDALRHPDKLLEEVQNLWKRGKEIFVPRVSRRSSAKQLAALVHVVHMAVSNIIESNSDSRILDAARSFLEGKDGLLEDIRTIRSKAAGAGNSRFSYTSDEKMALQLAENECIIDMINVAQKRNEPIDDRSLVALCENTFFLQNFDGARLPKGCSDVVYNVVPMLAHYWKEHPSQAQSVAKSFYTRMVGRACGTKVDDKEVNSLNPVGGIGTIGQFRNGPNGDKYVDLINLRVCRNGSELKSFTGTFENEDYQRLFAGLDSSDQTFVSFRNEYSFEDARYGRVEIRESRDGLRIYRQISEAGKTETWCYVSQKSMERVALPACFSGDDFTVWVNGDGAKARIKVCSKNNPEEVLYKTDELGYLCDVKRKEQKIEPYRILLSGKNTFPEFAQFEPEGQLIYCDESGKPSEIAFPRYRDSAGAMLRFQKSGNDWKLMSNPSFKVVSTPLSMVCFQENNGRWELAKDLATSGKKSLPFGEYRNVLCLQSGNGEYKCLLPDENISRRSGTIRGISSDSGGVSKTSDFFASSRYAEVSLNVQALDFDEMPLRAPDALAKLRLAHIFQTQKKYEHAAALLDDLPIRGNFNQDEVAMLSRIAKWFYGPDESSLNALVVIKALACMLRSSPIGKEEASGNDSKNILNEIRDFDYLVKRYLSGFSSYPPSMQLNWAEEKLFWEQVIKFCSIRYETKTNIENRIEDLTFLISSKDFANEIKNLPNNQQAQALGNRMHALYKADAGLRARVETESQIAFSEKNFRTPNQKAVNESGIYKKLESINPEFFKDPSKVAGGDNARGAEDVQKKIKVDLTGNDSRQIKDLQKTAETEFSENFVRAQKTLEARWNDPVAREVPTVGKIKDLLGIVESQKKAAINRAKNAAAEIDKIGNAGWLEATYGGGKQGKLKIPAAVRAYEIFVASGPKSALEFLQAKYPWFAGKNSAENSKKLSDFLQQVESYLIGINEERYLANVQGKLRDVNECASENRNDKWVEALPILRQVRNENLSEAELRTEDPKGKKVKLNDNEVKELKGILLTFEYMTGIRPRNDQIDMLKFIVKNVSNSQERSTLIQQIMGSGKTKVLIPTILATLLNREGKLPMIVSFEAQMPNVMLEFPELLERLGARLDAKSLDYEQCLDPDAIREFTERLKIAHRNRDSVFALDARILEAMKTAYKSVWTVGNGQNEQRRYATFEALTEFFEFLEENVVAIMDEVHDTMNPTKSHIFPVLNSKERISQADTSFLFDFIYNLGAGSNEHSLDVIAKIRENTQDQIPAEDIKNVLRECVRNVYLPKLYSLRVFVGNENSLVDFICGDFDGTTAENEIAKGEIEEVQRFLDGLNESVKHQVLLLRKICSGTLVQCLSRTYGEHYMFNHRGEIVPCRGGQPTNNHYQDPYEALCYFTIATIAKGIPAVTFDKWLEGLGESARAQASNGTPFEKTDPAKIFENLFGAADENGNKIFDFRKIKNEAKANKEKYDVANEELKEKLSKLKVAEEEKDKAGKEVTEAEDQLAELKRLEGERDAASKISTQVENFLKSINNDKSNGLGISGDLLFPGSEAGKTEKDIGDIFSEYKKAEEKLNLSEKDLEQKRKRRDDLNDAKGQEGSVEKVKSDAQAAKVAADKAAADLAEKQKILEIVNAFQALEKDANSGISELEKQLTKYNNDLKTYDAKKQALDKKQGTSQTPGGKLVGGDIETIENELSASKTERDKQELRVKVTEMLRKLMLGAELAVGDPAEAIKTQVGLAKEFANFQANFEKYEKDKAELEQRRAELSKLQNSQTDGVDGKSKIEVLGDELEKKRLTLEIAKNLPHIIGGGEPALRNLENEFSKLVNGLNMCDNFLLEVEKLDSKSKPESFEGVVKEYEEALKILNEREEKLQQGKNSAQGNADSTQRNIDSKVDELRTLYTQKSGNASNSLSPEEIVANFKEKIDELGRISKNLSEKEKVIENFRDRIVGNENQHGEIGTRFEELKTKIDTYIKAKNVVDAKAERDWMSESVGFVERQKKTAERELEVCEKFQNEEDIKNYRDRYDINDRTIRRVVENYNNALNSHLLIGRKDFFEKHNGDFKEKIKELREIEGKGKLSEADLEELQILFKIEDILSEKDWASLGDDEKAAKLSNISEILEEPLKKPCPQSSGNIDPKSKNESDEMFVSREIQIFMSRIRIKFNRLDKAMKVQDKIDKHSGNIAEAEKKLKAKKSELQSAQSKLEDAQNALKTAKGKLKAPGEDFEKWNSKTAFENLRGAYEELSIFSRAVDNFNSRLGIGGIEAFTEEEKRWNDFESEFKLNSEAKITTPGDFDKSFEEKFRLLEEDVEQKVGNKERAGETKETFNQVIQKVYSEFESVQKELKSTREALDKANALSGEINRLKLDAEKTDGVAQQEINDLRQSIGKLQETCNGKLEAVKKLYEKFSNELQFAEARQTQIKNLGNALNGTWEDYQNKYYGSNAAAQNMKKVEVPENFAQNPRKAFEDILDKIRTTEDEVSNLGKSIGTFVNGSKGKINENLQNLHTQSIEFARAISLINTWLNLLGKNASDASLESLKELFEGTDVNLSGLWTWVASNEKLKNEAWKQFLEKTKKNPNTEDLRNLLAPKDSKTAEGQLDVAKFGQLLKNINEAFGNATSAANKIPSEKDAQKEYDGAKTEKTSTDKTRQRLEREISELDKKLYGGSGSRAKLIDEFSKLQTRVEILQAVLPKLNELIGNVPESTSSHENWSHYFTANIADIFGKNSPLNRASISKESATKAWEAFIGSVAPTNGGKSPKDISEENVDDLMKRLNDLKSEVDGCKSILNSNRVPSVESVDENYKVANKNYESILGKKVSLENEINALKKELFGIDRSGKVIPGQGLESRLDGELRAMIGQLNKISAVISGLSDDAAIRGEDGVANAAFKDLEKCLSHVKELQEMLKAAPQKVGENKTMEVGELDQAIKSLKGEIRQLEGKFPSTTKAESARKIASDADVRAKQNLNAANAALNNVQDEKNNLDREISKKEKEISEELKPGLNKASKAITDLYDELSRKLKVAEERESEIGELLEVSDADLKGKLESYKKKYDKGPDASKGVEKAQRTSDKKVTKTECEALLKRLNEANKSVKEKENSLREKINEKNNATEASQKKSLIEIEAQIKGLNGDFDEVGVVDAWKNFEDRKNSASATVTADDKRLSEGLENLRKKIESNLRNLETKAKTEQNSVNGKLGKFKTNKQALSNRINEARRNYETKQEVFNRLKIECSEKEAEVSKFREKGPVILGLIEDIKRQEKLNDDAFDKLELRLDKVVNLQATGDESKVSRPMSLLMRFILAQDKGFEISTKFAARFAQEAHGEYFSDSYESTAIDLASLFKTKISMTGTPNNRKAYPENMRSEAGIKLQEGKLEEIAAKLVKDCESKNTQIVAFNDGIGLNSPKTVAGILNQWQSGLGESNEGKKKKENLRIIVDAGAQFKDQNPRASVVDIANFIRGSEGNDAKFAEKHIEYYDPDLESWAIVKARDVINDPTNFKSKKIINQKSDRPAKVEDLFTFIDFAHTTGSDPYLMKNGHGIMTVNLVQTDMEKFVQAIMRERKFLDENSQTMDLIMYGEAVNNVFNVTSASNVGAAEAVKKTLEDGDFIYKLFGRLLRNSSEKLRREQVRAGLNKIHGEVHEFIEDKLRKYYKEASKNNNMWAVNELFQKTENLMKSFQDFGVDSWRSELKWQSVQDYLGGIEKNLIEQLRDAFSGVNISGINLGGDLNALEKKLDGIVGEFPKEMQMLGFNMENEIQQEQQQEMEQEKEQIRDLYEFLRNPLRSEPCKERELNVPGHHTSAWDWIRRGELGGNSLGKFVRHDNFDFSKATQGVRAKQNDYIAAKSLFPERIDSQFFVSENFSKTVNGPQSVFNSEQKDVTFMLIYWDPKNKSYDSHRCYFISQKDAEAVQKMIDGGNLVNCRLYTPGAKLPKTGEETGPNEPDANFLRQALGMAHTFNSDVAWVDANPEVSEEVFKLLGMPTEEEQMENPRAMQEFLNKLNNFLLLRTKTLRQTNRMCKNSTLISFGQSKDPYIDFLIENKLTEFSPTSEILDKLASFDNANELEGIILSAVGNGKIDPGFILSRLHLDENPKVKKFLEISSDPYALFLSKNGFTDSSRESDILNALAESNEIPEAWGKIVISAVKSKKISSEAILSHGRVSERLKSNDKARNFVESPYFNFIIKNELIGSSADEILIFRELEEANETSKNLEEIILAGIDSGEIDPRSILNHGDILNRIDYGRMSERLKKSNTKARNFIENPYFNFLFKNKLKADDIDAFLDALAKSKKTPEEIEEIVLACIKKSDALDSKSSLSDFLCHDGMREKLESNAKVCKIIQNPYFYFLFRSELDESSSASDILGAIAKFHPDYIFWREIVTSLLRQNGAINPELILNHSGMRRRLESDAEVRRLLENAEEPYFKFRIENEIGKHSDAMRALAKSDKTSEELGEIVLSGIKNEEIHPKSSDIRKNGNIGKRLDPKVLELIGKMEDPYFYFLFRNGLEENSPKSNILDALAKSDHSDLKEIIQSAVNGKKIDPGFILSHSDMQKYLEKKPEVKKFLEDARR